MYFIYVLSLFWYAVLTFPCVRIELSSQSFKCDGLGLWNLLAKLGWEKDDDREQQFDSLSRTTHDVSQPKGTLSNPFLWWTKKPRPRDRYASDRGVVTYPRSAMGLGTCQAPHCSLLSTHPFFFPRTCGHEGWGVTVSTLALPWTLQASRHNPTAFLIAMNQ